MKRPTYKLGCLAMAAATLLAACGDDNDAPTDTDDDAAPVDTSAGRADTAPEPASDGSNGTVFEGQTPEEATAIITDLVGQVEPADGDTTRGVTDDEVIVKAVTGLVTAQNIEPFPGQCEGAQARVERANAEGGVNGRTITWAGCADDGSDRARNGQLMQEAVEQDDAFALFPVTSQGFFSEDYLNENHVPYFGMGFQPGYCGFDRPFAFGNTLTVCEPDAIPGHAVSTPGQYLALADALGMEDLSGQTVFAVYEDTPSSKAGIPIVNRSIVDTGAEIAGTLDNLPAPPAPPVTDFTPYVNQVVGDSPDIVVLITGPENQIGMSGGLKAAGFDGVIAGYNYSDSRIFQVPQVLEALDGTYQINVGIGHAVFGGPVFEQIRADLDAAGFDSQAVTGGVLIGYSAADMFVHVLAQVPEPLTTEAFVNTINDGYTYPGLDNAVCKSDWPLGHYGGPFCYSVLRIDKDETNFTAASDLAEYPFAVVEID